MKKPLATSVRADRVALFGCQSENWLAESLNRKSSLWPFSHANPRGSRRSKRFFTTERLFLCIRCSLSGDALMSRAANAVMLQRPARYHSENTGQQPRLLNPRYRTCRLHWAPGRVHGFATARSERWRSPVYFETRFSLAQITTRSRLNPAWPKQQAGKVPVRHKTVRRADDCFDTRKLADPGAEGMRGQGQREVSANRPVNSEPTQSQLVLPGITKARDAMTQAGLVRDVGGAGSTASGRVRASAVKPLLNCMKTNIIEYPRFDSEMDVQFELCKRLEDGGWHFRNNVKAYCIDFGKTHRVFLDVVVFTQAEKPVCIIEVKNRRGNGKRKLGLRQGRRYSQFNVPVLVCFDRSDVDSTIEKLADLSHSTES